MSEPKQASSERRASLLLATGKAAKNFAAILDFDQLLQQTVDIICEEFGFYYAGVFLTDSSGKWALLRSGRGTAGKAMLKENHRLEIGGNSMIGDCIAKKGARISLDVGDEAVFFKNPHLPKTRSEMGLPLILGENVIGALTVQSTEEAAFSQEDITTLQTLADLLAVAIENARLHQKEEKRANYLAAANEVGKNLTTILNLDELLPKTVDVICKTYNFYYAGVFLVDETNQWAVLKAGYGEAGKVMIEEAHKLEIGGNSMIGDCLAKKEARISLDVGEEAVFFKNPHLPKTRSEMGLPLLVGDEVLGAVTVQSIEEAAFSDEDIYTLQTMADHLAIAIKNAQSMKELEKAHTQILRQKTFEALATSTTQAIHWIGNKALPITTTIDRLKLDLEEKIIDVESISEDLDLINSSAKTIIKVKENLLGSAREEAPRPIMVEDIAYASASYLNIPKEKFIIEVSDKTPLIIGDSTQLTRVFTNFYKNSLEANAEKIHIKISPTENFQNLQVTIMDDGEGISEDMKEKIWASFVTTKGPNHEGLGLPAALHVITQHEGSVTVESEEGKGTTFNLLFPAADKPKPQKFNRVQNKILLISEETPWSNFIISTLEDASVEVTRSTKQKNNGNYDLILLDDAIPIIREIIDRLVESGNISNTVILSTGLTVEKTTGYLKHNPKNILLKPYTQNEVQKIFSD